MIGVNGKKGGILYYSPTADQYVKIGKAWRANSADGYDVVYTSGYLNYVTGSLPLELKYSKGKPLVNWSITGNTEMWSISPNLWDPATTFKTGYYKNDDGVEVAYDTAEYSVNYTPVQPNTNYCISTKATDWFYFRVYFYTKDKQWIQRTENTSSNAPFVTPSNCYYIQLQVITNEFVNEEVMLNAGTEHMSYVPYGYSAPGATPTPEAPVEVKMVGEKTGNLFDYSTLIEGYFDYDTGTLVWNQSSASRQNYRTVKATLETGNYCISTTEDIKIVRFLNGTSFSKTTLESPFNFEVTEKTDVYISFRLNPMSVYHDINIMLNEGTEPLPYEPFGYRVPVVTRGTNLWNESFSNFGFSKVDDYFVKYIFDTDTVYWRNDTNYIGQITVSYMCYFGSATSRGWRFKFAYSDGTRSQIYIPLDLCNNQWGKVVATSTSGKIVTSILSDYGTNRIETRIKDFQIELGSTATDYEPYHESTTNLYLPTPLAKGEVLRSDGSREVKWKTVRLTSDMEWINNAGGTGRFTTTIVEAKLPTSQSEVADIYCSHLPHVSANTLYKVTDPCIAFNIVSSNNVWIQRSYWNNNPYIFKKWLDDNEVYLTYALNSPTTETIPNLPEIQTIKSTTIIDVDTEVKPESMTATYVASKKDTAMTQYLELLNDI